MSAGAAGVAASAGAAGAKTSAGATGAAGAAAAVGAGGVSCANTGAAHKVRLKAAASAAWRIEMDMEKLREVMGKERPAQGPARE